MNIKSDAKYAAARIRFLSFLLLILSFAILLCILALPPGRVNNTILFSIVPFAAFSCLQYQELRRGGGCSVQSVFFPLGADKRRAAFSLILTLLFFFLLSVKEIWIGLRPFTPASLLLLYLAVLFTVSFLTIDFCLASYLTNPTEAVLARPDGAAAQNGAEAEPPFVKAGPFRLYYIMIPLTAAVVLILTANFPWRPSPDATAVYGSVINGWWSDWHTIGYLTFVNLCMKMFSPSGMHPFSVLAVQSVIWLALTNYAMDRLYTWTGSQKAVKVYGLLNLVIFTPLIYLAVMFKDVIFAMFMLGFGIESYHLIRLRSGRPANYLLLALFASGVALFRHMGMEMAVVVLCALLVYYIAMRRKDVKMLCLSALAPILVFFLVTAAYGSWYLHMEKNPAHVKYTVPLYIVGNLASEHPEMFDAEQIALIEEIMPFEDWSSGYELDPYLADNLSREYCTPGDRIRKVDDAYGRRLLKLNARMLLKNPDAYLSALLRVTSIIWQIARPQDGYEWTIAGHYVPEDRPDLAKQGLVSTRKALCELLDGIEYYVNDQPILSAIYFRGGFWLFSLMFLTAVLLLRGQKRLIFGFALPALAACLMMLSCPSQDPRFTLPYFEAALFFLPAIYYDRSRPARKREHTKTQRQPKKTGQEVF